jgi:hypothetical protein
MCTSYLCIQLFTQGINIFFYIYKIILQAAFILINILFYIKGGKILQLKRMLYISF